ncbi:threonine synthase, partial [Francisella tularensis]|uniref:threonine synthase n=1 Tax=Francisella tularensis TaxID=263 RepID=UPI002381C12F
LLKKYEEGRLQKGSTVVCVLSGEGLKDPGVVLKSALQPPIIYPSETDFDRLDNSHFFDNKTMLFIEQNEGIFDKLPILDEVKKTLGKLFWCSL